RRCARPCSAQRPDAGAAQGPRAPGERWWRGTEMRRYECSYRRWHDHRVTKRARYVPISAGPLPVTWYGLTEIDGSTSRGCLVAMLGPWGLMRGVGDPLGCPWSRGP